jgi:hypothetical protein
VLDVNKRANEKKKGGRKLIPQSSWKMENVITTIMDALNKEWEMQISIQ